MSNESSSSPQQQQHNNNNNNNNNKSHKSMSTTNSSSQNHEDELRKSLRQALQSLGRREPLEPTYRRLILQGQTVTSRRPVLVKDRFYRHVGSRLRDRVESFLAVTQGKDPFDRISQRRPLEDSAMRAALTLREAKDHEQQPLLDATLAALSSRGMMDERTRKRHFEGMALLLQTEKKKTSRTTNNNKGSLATTTNNNNNNSNSILSAVELTEQARHHAELERQRAQARARELARRRRDEEERQQAQEELAAQRKRKEMTTITTTTSPEQTTLHKYYHPIFKKLWDMEFGNLNSTNPFRIVIDRDNCAAMGAADYFDVIKTPVST
jgi:hypothetical protein